MDAKTEWVSRAGRHWLKPPGALKALVWESGEGGVSWMLYWNAQRIAGVLDVSLSIEAAKAHARIALNAFSAAWSDYNQAKGSA